MPYRYLEEIATADVAFEATGATLEELIVSAADATMNVMVHDLADIDPAERIDIEAENDSIDMLLFDLLQELVFYKDAKGLLLRIQEVSVRNEDGIFRAGCVCRGEPIDPARHKLIVDVKAVTLHLFSVEETSAGWKARVILDI